MYQADIYTVSFQWQVFYFMQPETTALKMVQDINTKLKERQHGPRMDDASSSIEVNSASTANISSSEEINSASPAPSDKSCKVVSLYTPAGSAVKLFCVHPSHRFALSLAAFASGFKFQVSVKKVFSVCQFPPVYLCLIFWLPHYVSDPVSVCLLCLFTPALPATVPTCPCIYLSFCLPVCVCVCLLTISSLSFVRPLSPSMLWVSWIQPWKVRTGEV